jgi:diguanylate cyclase (GGDEF)-like protein
MSISLAMGIIAIVNLAIGYAMALVIESHEQGTASAPQTPLDAALPIHDSPTQACGPDPGSICASEPVAGTPAADKPDAPSEAEVAIPTEDANASAEQLLEATTALANELNQFANTVQAPAEPRALLGDAAQLETAIHDWWHNDPGRSRPICVGQIEIDHLSQLTSKLGAASMGSLAKQIERLVLSMLRRDDLVASLGRSRFLAVLPDVNAAAAAQLLEALRARVDSSAFATEDGPIQITLSAAATQARNDDDVEILLTRSAVALREACGAGRNRVACDDGISVTLVESK